jgi:hypothetical protein
MLQRTKAGDGGDARVMSIGPDGPDEVLDELRRSTAGDTVDGLGNVPMQGRYARELAARCEGARCAVAGAVSTTARGRLPGTVVHVELRTEGAVYAATYEGHRWRAEHPAYLTGGEGVMSFESFEEYEEARGSGPGAAGLVGASEVGG